MRSGRLGKCLLVNKPTFVEIVSTRYPTNGSLACINPPHSFLWSPGSVRKRRRRRMRTETLRN